MLQSEFWASQRVLLTGHTGFKGSWMMLWLERLGASIFGFSLPPDQSPNLFSHLAPVARFISQFGDIRNLAELKAFIAKAKPTIAIHMAAQPLVRRSYANPVETFTINTLGTVNVLEVLRDVPDLCAILVITTDKVYQNIENGRNFEEDDPLGGSDPYSASKAAADLIVQSYAQSFFEPARKAVGVARAGNVLGGGDWSEDRLIPDIWRAKRSGLAVAVRYPQSTRPWQHVLDPLAGYLLFMQRLACDPTTTPRALNFGPAEGSGQMTVGQVADFITKGLGTSWVQATDPQLSEAKHLALNPQRAMQTLGWRPRLGVHEALEWTLDWYRRFDTGENPRDITVEHIERYTSLLSGHAIGCGPNESIPMRP
jgi:CDP-glucose 4,6-dehydratase